MIVTLQIMSGTNANTFSPQGKTTRAQAAAVLVRTLKTLGWID
ncbi:S-layer homology domain-containing protein [Cohnella soli]|uniref:S-layer homology domain-containing protein n=1 Tax=Cohnella soli TaxID=425005 RepID=A0ABW0HUD7_9BACL